MTWNRCFSMSGGGESAWSRSKNPFLSFEDIDVYVFHRRRHWRRRKAFGATMILSNMDPSGRALISF